MRIALTGLATALLLFGYAEAAIAQCQLCTDCGGSDHQVVPHAIIGTTDGTHGCFGYSCFFMQASGVHEFNCYDSLAMTGLEAATSDGTLTSMEASSLAATFPRNVLVDRSRGAVQILSCDGMRVVAEAAIALSLRQRVQHAIAAAIKAGPPVVRTLMASSGRSLPQRLS
jgi:hypothetical protein